MPCDPQRSALPLNLWPTRVAQVSRWRNTRFFARVRLEDLSQALRFFVKNAFRIIDWVRLFL